MTTYTGSRKSSARRQLVAAVGAALAIGVAAGVGSWQLGLPGRSSSRATTVMQGQAVRGSQPVPAVGDRTTVMATAARAAGDQTPQLVLVGSAQQALQTQQALDDRDAVCHQWGEAPLPAEVVQVEPATLSATLQAVADLNAVRQTLGLPDIEVVDLGTGQAALGA